MEAGASAVEAVKAAVKWDIGCGGPVIRKRCRDYEGNRELP
jgi:hypothetical protein